MPYPANPNELSFAQPQASRLFQAIAHDTLLPRAAGPKHHARVVPPVLDAAPGTVKVQVLNGSGVTGLASRAAAALTGRGFDVTGTGDAASFGYASSVIEYASPASQPQVATLARQFSSVTVRRGVPAAAANQISRCPGRRRASQAPAKVAAATRLAPASPGPCKHGRGVRPGTWPDNGKHRAAHCR